jgi:hypothetical protein
VQNAIQANQIVKVSRMAGRKKGSKDVAPMVRGAFVRAVKALEDGGRPLSDIIREQLEKHPLHTLKTISSFVPKELEMTVNEVEEASDADIDAAIRAFAARAGFVPSDTGEGEERQH